MSPAILYGGTPGKVAGFNTQNTLLYSQTITVGVPIAMQSVSGFITNFYSEQVRNFLDQQALKWEFDAELAYVSLKYIDSEGREYVYVSQSSHTCLVFQEGGASGPEPTGDATPVILGQEQIHDCPPAYQVMTEFPYNWKINPETLFQGLLQKYPSNYSYVVESVDMNDSANGNLLWRETVDNNSLGKVVYSQIIDDSTGQAVQ